MGSGWARNAVGAVARSSLQKNIRPDPRSRRLHGKGRPESSDGARSIHVIDHRQRQAFDDALGVTV